MSQIINEAFKELKGLDEATFSFDKQGVMELRDFLHQNYEEPTFIDVVDPAAETAEDVKDSYEGDVILQCCVCDAYITKSPKDVFIDKATGRANVNEMCPSCWNTGGFTIVSQVKDPYAEDEEVTSVATDEIEDDPDLEIVTDEITVEDKDEDADVENEPLQESKEDEDEADYGATFIVYELDEDGEEVKRVATFEEDEEDAAIEFARAQSFPTHVVYVPNVDPDDDPSVADYFDDQEKAGGYGAFEIVWESPQEDEPLTEAKKKKDLWTTIYGELADDGEQIISDDGTPRSNKGIGFTYKQINVTADGDIELRAPSEKDFDEARDVISKYMSRGVSYEIRKDKYDRRNPYRFIVKFPEGAVSEAVKECADAPLTESATADIILEEDDILEFDGDTGDISLRPDFDASKGDYIKVAFSDDNAKNTYQFKVADVSPDEIKLEYISSIEECANQPSTEDVPPEALKEAVENVTVTTDTDVINVTPEENGGVNVNTQPKESSESVEGEEDVLAPVDAEVMAEIEANEPEEEETSEESESTGDEDVEFSIDDFDEETFDELGESYLKEVYGNVDSYETTRGYINKNRLKLEGIITFKSGKQVNTSFLFENYMKMKSGKIKFLGENEQITSKKNSFILKGTISNKKLMVESLTYNYNAKDATTGKTKKVYGKVLPEARS